MTSFLQYVVDGLSVGSLYVLVAVGFTLVFGVMGLMNVAHADLFMIAAFGLAWFASDLGLGVTLGSLAAIVLAVGVGMTIYVLVLNRLDKTQALTLFVGTLGVSYFLENFVAKLVDFKTRSVPPLFETVYYTVVGVQVSNAQLALFGCTLALSIGLLLWLSRTEKGRLLRAVSESPTLAQLVAIPTGAMTALAVFIASLIAAIGALLVTNTTQAVDPFIANTVSLKMFAVAVVAGVGSVKGSVVVGLGLGIVEALTVGYFGSQWQNVIGLLAMVLVLLIRPQGLFGTRLRVG